MVRRRPAWSALLLAQACGSAHAFSQHRSAHSLVHGAHPATNVSLARGGSDDSLPPAPPTGNVTATGEPVIEHVEPLPTDAPLLPWEVECHALVAILAKDGVIRTDELRRAID